MNMNRSTKEISCTVQSCTMNTIVRLITSLQIAERVKLLIARHTNAWCITHVLFYLLDTSRLVCRDFMIGREEGFRL